MKAMVAIALGLSLIATPAFAYIGPGAGITVLGALWGVVVAVVLALAAILPVAVACAVAQAPQIDPSGRRLRLYRTRGRCPLFRTLRDRGVEPAGPPKEKWARGRVIWCDRCAWPSADRLADGWETGTLLVMGSVGVCP
jgi:hypothetical protein